MPASELADLLRCVEIHVSSPECLIKGMVGTQCKGENPCCEKFCADRDSPCCGKFSVARLQEINGLRFTIYRIPMGWFQRGY